MSAALQGWCFECGRGKRGATHALCSVGQDVDAEQKRVLQRVGAERQLQEAEGVSEEALQDLEQEAGRHSGSTQTLTRSAGTETLDRQRQPVAV